MDIEDIAGRYFAGMDRESVVRYWQQLADALGVNPGLLRPDDPISYYIPRHLPELTVDAVERFLEAHGVKKSDVNLDTPVQEIIVSFNDVHRREANR